MLAIVRFAFTALATASLAAWLLLLALTFDPPNGGVAFGTTRSIYYVAAYPTRLLLCSEDKQTAPSLRASK